VEIHSEMAGAWPRHVAIIMDGNGRWASQRHLPRLEGHRQGAKAVRRTVEFCRKSGIQYLTLYAFSTENWQRPKKEVTGLMKLLSQFIDSELDEIHANGIRFMTIGDMSRLPPNLIAKIERAKARTRENVNMSLIVALSYGGRQEIVNAALKLATKLQGGELKVEQVDEHVFAKLLDTSDIPDPDLLIRTGGEVRVSNFLLWQLAYTELYFTPILWPDFDEKALSQALDEYGSRQRRFGMIPDQLDSPDKTSRNTGDMPCCQRVSSPL
jgi:undecaprenyl diphosphate synthase